MTTEAQAAPAAEPDINAPALSESVGGAPEPASPSASNAAPAEPAAAEAPEAPPEAESPPPAPEPPADPLAAMRAELAALRQRVETPPAPAAVAPEPPPAPRAPEPPAPRPKRAEFADPDAYEAAVDQWHTAETARVARETVRAAQEESERAAVARRASEVEAAEQTRHREHMTALTNNWNRQRAEALARYPDFVAVAERQDVQVTPSMAMTIMQTPNGADLAYHLGKNPTEAATIAALPPVMQAFELGRIAARLTAPAAPKVSRAPDPIRPVGGATPAVATRLEDMAMDDYAANRQAKLDAARRGPGARPH